MYRNPIHVWHRNHQIHLYIILMYVYVKVEQEYTFLEITMDIKIIAIILNFFM